MDRELDRELVRRRLAGFEVQLETTAEHLSAAVAAVLSPGPAGGIGFLITRRAATLRRHSGQWALPGGRLDPGETVFDAARRELAEEVGVELDEDAVLGRLDDFVTRSGFVISPVVLWSDDELDPVPEPAEVAAVYHVELDTLDRPDVPRLREIPESERPVISLPILGDFVHAPTAAIVFQLFEVVHAGRHTRVGHFEQPVFAWS